MKKVYQLHVTIFTVALISAVNVGCGEDAGPVPDTDAAVDVSIDVSLDAVVDIADTEPDGDAALDPVSDTDADPDISDSSDSEGDVEIGDTSDSDSDSEDADTDQDVRLSDGEQMYRHCALVNGDYCTRVFRTCDNVVANAGAQAWFDAYGVTDEESCHEIIVPLFCQEVTCSVDGGFGTFIPERSRECTDWVSTTSCADYDFDDAPCSSPVDAAVETGGACIRDYDCIEEWSVCWLGGAFDQMCMEGTCQSMPGPDEACLNDGRCGRGLQCEEGTCIEF